MTVWVGRYAMVSGQVREHGPWLVDRMRRREDENLRVLILAEPVDARSAEFGHEVAEAVAALFSRESLSITGGLLRSLRQAHANLAEWNRRSLREHRVAVGVTCVVVRDDEVLIAQAGGGVAYIRQGGVTSRLATEGMPAAIPLGSDEAIEPLFTSASLTDGQVLLLSSNAAAALGPRTIQNALDTGPEQALAQLFPHTRNLSDMTAVLVADLDIDEEQAAPPLDFDDHDQDDTVEGREVALTGLDDERPDPPRPRRPRGWKVLSTESAGSKSGTPLPSIRRTRSVGQRLGASAPLVPWRTAAIVAGVAILLAILAWTLLPGLLSEDRAQELEDTIATAQIQLQAAAALADPDQQRAALQTALTAAEAARALAPDDPRVTEIVAEANARLQILDAVTEISDLTEVVTFDGSITAPVQPEEIIAGGTSLWLRDSGRGRVIRIDPRGVEDPQELFRSGEEYGEVTSRDPVAIAWDASLGRLLVMDAGRVLYALNDEAEAIPEVLPLRDGSELRSVVAISAYLGNLYVLDPVAGEVWRYLPAAEGFDSERTGILGGIDLTDATGLAVDGDVFVLAGSTLRHFSQGRETEPLLQGIDRAPETTSGLVEDILRGVLYLADRSGNRIIAAERTGPFLRQYRHPDLIDLRGVAISPNGTTLYALTGSGVQSFPIAAGSGGGASPTPTPTATATQ